MLDKIVRRCDSIDKESLCVLATQRVSTGPRIFLCLSLHDMIYLGLASSDNCAFSS